MSDLRHEAAKFAHVAKRLFIGSTCANGHPVYMDDKHGSPQMNFGRDSYCKEDFQSRGLCLGFRVYLQVVSKERKKRICRSPSTIFQANSQHLCSIPTLPEGCSPFSGFLVTPNPKL